MKSPHCELRSRLADRLRCDDPNGLTKIDPVATPEIAAVAHNTNSPTRCACQHGPDLDALKPRLLDTLYEIFVDLLVGLNDHFAGKRIFDIFKSDSAENSISQRLDDFPAFH